MNDAEEFVRDYNERYGPIDPANDRDGRAQMKKQGCVCGLDAWKAPEQHLGTCPMARR